MMAESRAPCRRWFVRVCLHITLVGALGAIAPAAMGAAAAPDGGAADASRTQPGVWQKHVYDFAFLGFTSTYSCDGLAAKLKTLLLLAGARPDVRAQPGACAAFGRPDKFARATLTFYTLSPAVAPASGGNDPLEVPGSWLPVSIAAHEPNSLQLGVGDCELVEQFEVHVLPMFATRDVQSHTTCIPNEESGSNIDLRFQSFEVAHAASAGDGLR